MKNDKINNIVTCRKLYEKGKNISLYLRKKYNLNYNSKENIEIIYELQTGSYIDEYHKYKSKYDKYSEEIASYLNDNIKNNYSILDVGCGEITVLTNIINFLRPKKNINVYAFDISLSRIKVGMNFFKKNIKLKIKNNFFVGEMTQIPLPNNSVDLVISSHSLEPNGGMENEIVEELLRVAKRKIILFEPCYEKTKKKKIKNRIEKLGYIKCLEKYFRKQGAHVEAVFPIENSIDENNPTFCYIINPLKKYKLKNKKIHYTDPGTDYPLQKKKNFYQSKASGFIYPVINDIPILNIEKGIICLS